MERDDVERDDPAGASTGGRGDVGRETAIVRPAEGPAPSDASAGGLVPDWLENVAALGWRALVIGGVVVVLAYLATLVWTVTASIAVAAVVAAVLAPFVLRLRDRGRTRNAAAGIVWAVTIVTSVAVLLLLVLAFLPHVASLAAGLRDGLLALDENVAQADLPTWATTLADDAVESLSATGGDLVGTIVAEAASAVTVLVLATFLLFFFLRDGDKAWLWAFQGLGEEKRELITSAGDDALDRVGGYLRGTTVLAAIIGATNYAFMVLLGVPLALPLAILSFAATYIPYFGGLVATLGILLVTFGALGTAPTVVMVVLLGLRGLLTGYLVRPMLYRRTVHLHPALVLVVLPAGFELAGVVGLFAAVPLTAVVMTVFQAATTIIEPSPAPPLPALVPAWLDRAAQWSWRLLVAVAVVAAIVLALTWVPLVLLPAILALILAATLEPLVSALTRRGRSRTSATALSVVGSLVAIVGVLALALVSIVDQAGELGDTLLEGAGGIDEAAGGNLGLVVEAVDTGVRVTTDQILAVSDALATLGAILLLGALLTFYFLRDGASLWAAIMRHVRRGAAAELTAAGARAIDVLGGYMLGTGAISFVGAFSQWVIMVVLGLPLALPVFVLSFFGGYIPYIGSALTTLLAFLIAVAVGDPVDILVMLLWTIVFNLVQGNIVAPLVYGRTTHIHPAVVLASIPAGSAIAGILGMFLVVPALGVVSATWRTLLSVMGSPGPSGVLGSPGPPEAAPATGGSTPASEPRPEDVAPGSA